MPAQSLRRLILAAASGLLVAVALVPIAPQGVAAVDGSSFVTVVNRYRADAKLTPVSLHSVVDRIAVERGKQLAAARTLGHDFDYLKKRLNEEGVCWQALGEIVAWNNAPASERIERFVKQWYDSEPHRKIMLGSSYTHAGGSWTTGSDGRHYGAMVFVKICGAAPASSSTQNSPTFVDIDSSAFKTEINWLVNAGITQGCAAKRFCPTDVVLREQMASFIKRALNLPSATRDYFRDDARSGHQDDINRIAQAGLTKGCAAGRYCPTSNVTREQMASFLVRAFRLPATTRDYFADDTGSVHEDAINRLAAAGITNGCAARRYCPSSPVPREQMAAFLYRAFH